MTNRHLPMTMSSTNDCPIHKFINKNIALKIKPRIFFTFSLEQYFQDKQRSE